MSRLAQLSILCLYLSPVGSSDVEGNVDFSVDDECGDGESACALNALQRKAANSDSKVLNNEESAREESGCHDIKETDTGVCMAEIQWARHEGLSQHPDWYPGMTLDTPLVEWQMHVYNTSHPKCPRPCALPKDSKWCQNMKPPKLWKPASFPKEDGATTVKILSYNLFWWHLFGVEGGRGGSASKLIRQHMTPEPFDVMGFQECEDPAAVLNPAGLQDEYTAFQGVHAVCIAYRNAAWTLIDQNLTDVAQDIRTEYYGTRGVQWMRLKHRKTGRTLFFGNHHGPLSVNSGGLCGGQSTAYNLLEVMKTHAKEGDILVLVGDFNANAASRTVQSLWPSLTHVYNGPSFGGVDNIFANVPSDDIVTTMTLDKAGSDHHAIMATVRVGTPTAAQIEEAKKGATATTTTTAAPCKTAVQGDACWHELSWARTTGIEQHPDWYPGLTKSSTIEEFQKLVHGTHPDKCPSPCTAMTLEAPPMLSDSVQKAEPSLSVQVLENAGGADGCTIEPGLRYMITSGWVEYKPGVTDPRVCCTICQSNNNCKAWTLAEWDPNASGPQCTLYGGAISSKKNVEDWTSGLPKPMAVKEATAAQANTER